MDVIKQLENLAINVENKREKVVTVFNWSYWKSSAVAVYHYSNQFYEVYEIYTREALKLRITVDRESSEITWEIHSLNECANECSCPG